MYGADGLPMIWSYERFSIQIQITWATPTGRVCARPQGRPTDRAL
jgi:hypothetical protein